MTNREPTKAPKNEIKQDIIANYMLCMIKVFAFLKPGVSAEQLSTEKVRMDVIKFLVIRSYSRLTGFDALLIDRVVYNKFTIIL